MKLNYEKTFKIEILNEFSNGVYASLLNFILNNGIDPKDKTNFYNALLEQFVVMLNINLFDVSFEELEAMESYWEKMDVCVEEIKAR